MSLRNRSRDVKGVAGLPGVAGDAKFITDWSSGLAAAGEAARFDGLAFRELEPPAAFFSSSKFTLEL